MKNKAQSLFDNLKEKAISGVKKAPGQIRNYFRDRVREFPEKLAASNAPMLPPLADNQPTPTQVPLQPINITVPGKDGLPFRLPNRNNNPDGKLTAEDLFERLDPYGIATESAKVLIHPKQQTYTPQEIKRIGKESWNYGENPEFGTGEMKAPNPDGTFDYGPMRINDYSLNEMLNRPKVPYWKEEAEKKGISGLEDIKTNTRKNIDAALLMLLDSNYDVYKEEKEKQGTDTPNLAGKVDWKRWYAADKNLRYR